MAERPPLKVGDPIPGDKVESLTVGQIIDPPIGHLLVDQEQGNIHIYWYRWIKEGINYKKVLTHHGGSNGFDDIQKPIDQHQRIIAKYMGVETELDDRTNESEEKLLQPPFTLRNYAQALRIGYDRIEIPGERAWVGACLDLVERTIRGAAIKMPASELQSRLFNLSQLQQRFARSRNPYMQQASIHIFQAVESDKNASRDETMIALLETGRDINSRAQEISEILAGTIKRESLLENLRNRCEATITDVHFDLVKAKEKWDKAEDDLEREKVILNLTNLLGIRRLSELTVQPFRGRAQRRPLKRLASLGEYWASGDMELVGKVLTEGSNDIIIWRNQIKKRVEGEYNMRFPQLRS
ncbi:MAG: hypothetical protein Q8O68_01225 [Candidatus Daviesbacteria bacterium]|nr:hypothetical protein [Candidatus Daviesbacteria bacterium]